MKKTFERNLSNYTIINDNDIAKINNNIKNEMKPVILEYNRAQNIINKKYKLFK